MLPWLTGKLRLTRLGRIRLGEKRENAAGKEYPVALPHFNLADAPAVAAVYEKDGKPTNLIAPVIVPSNPRRSTDDNGNIQWDFSAYWKTSRSAYGRGSGLFCRSTDGETATRIHKGLGTEGKFNGKPLDPHGAAFLEAQGLDVKPGEMFQLPCLIEGEDACPYWSNHSCKNLGVFDVMLPDVPGFGVWTVQTSSTNSMLNIESSLQSLAAATGGIVAGIPFVMRLEPLEVAPDGKKKTVYVINLIPIPNLKQLATMARRAVAGGRSVVALIEGEVQTPDDLYPYGGAQLDRQIGAIPTRAEGEPSAAQEELRRRAKAAQPPPAAEAPAPIAPGIPEPENPFFVNDDEPPFAPMENERPAPPPTNTPAALRRAVAPKANPQQPLAVPGDGTAYNF